MSAVRVRLGARWGFPVCPGVAVELPAGVVAESVPAVPVLVAQGRDVG